MCLFNSRVVVRLCSTIVKVSFQYHTMYGSGNHVPPPNVLISHSSAVVYFFFHRILFSSLVLSFSFYCSEFWSVGLYGHSAIYYRWEKSLEACSGWSIPAEEKYLKTVCRFSMFADARAIKYYQDIRNAPDLSKFSIPTSTLVVVIVSSFFCYRLIIFHVFNGHKFTKSTLKKLYFSNSILSERSEIGKRKERIDWWGVTCTIYYDYTKLLKVYTAWANVWLKTQAIAFQYMLFE